MKKNANKGFSLVELIIVIAIMAVLIGVLAPQFIKQVERSKESTDLQNIEEYKTAIETAVSEGDITADVTITVNSTQISVPTTISTALAEYGLDATKSTKSSKWVEFSWSYSVTTYKWTLDDGPQTTTYFDENGNKRS